MATIGHMGFTGDIPGMTLPQAKGVLYLLEYLHPRNVHHGDCTGSDEQFHVLAKIAGCVRHVHPPNDGKHQAHCKGEVHYPPNKYLTRDQHIVDASEVLVATPSSLERVRSGTWATIRRARTKGIPRYIIMPDGETIYEADGQAIATRTS